MKRLLLVTIVTLLSLGRLLSNPVDVESAKSLAEKFVKANFELRQSVNVDLEYVVNTDYDEPCFYIFNVGEQAYVMVSANDCVRPIMAYSKESAFDKDNIAPGLQFMLDAIKESFIYSINEGVEASPEVEAEWKSLEEYGVLSVTRAKAVGPLCTTKWDQSWPYNKYCPESSASYSSHGHVVVGCAATAMSQLMRYWGYPAQGIGEYSYTDPAYGNQYVNYGETTYHWDLMPDELNADSPLDQIDAVATLCYHAGVSVDMQYDNTGAGSAALSSDVRRAMRDNFGYIDCEYSVKMNNSTWAASLKEAIEMGYPIFYSGYRPAPNGGGHAFICDGFDENGLFHFNFGWAGSGDGYFAPEGIEYTDQVVAYLKLIPQPVYDNTATAPTDFTVIPAVDNTLSADLSWKNPTKTQNGADMPAQFDVIVERNGEIIHTENNTTPGQTVTFVDNTLPFFSRFEYSVYAVVDGIHGEIAKINDVAFGPACTWKIILQSSVFTGGDAISVYNAAGDLVLTEKTNNSVAKTFETEMPLGRLSFVLTPSSKGDADDKLVVTIKNYDDETVFSNTFTHGELIGEPVVFSTINTCGFTEQCDAPSNLTAIEDDEMVILSWKGEGEPKYGYNVYRDGELLALVNETTYVDDDVIKDARAYVVTAFCESGDSPESNVTYVVTTEGCEPASDLSYEYNDKGKIKLMWNAPQNENVSGYHIMRKKGDATEWSRIKVVQGSKTEYLDNSSLEVGEWYYYQVIAYYQDIDCLSSPALSKDNDNEYYVKVSYTPNAIDEKTSQYVTIYPNPTKDKITVEADDIRNITLVNILGQKVYELSMNADQAVVDFSKLDAGLYMIQVTTEDYEIVERITVVR